eukprot:TRINITY_DN14606_c0_g1_i1.p1 TRINITY_DN14606_c0_g1~~TRINITY_DN14606_c0_g1_i1.p1  ORF type:complete len:181 (+),score=37.58 TRINITY_DN14606_c0_g1_i1:67-543(+)
MIKASTVTAVVLIACFTPFVSAGLVFSWQDCGTSANHVQVLGMTYFPENPQLGDNVTFVTNFTSNKVYTAGSTTIKAGGGIIDKTFDTCEGAVITAPLNMAKIVFPPAGCPVETGVQNNTHYSWLSKHAPTSPQTATLTSVDQDGQPGFCISILTKFV